MIEKSSVKIILMGDKNEKQLCRATAETMKAASLMIAGETTLGQTAALLAKCKLVVANDGGPLHMAVAVGAKTVSIFGPVDEDVYGPYPKGRHAVAAKSIACRPCYRRFRMVNCQHHSCLRLLEVDEVLKKIEEIL